MSSSRCTEPTGCAAQVAVGTGRRRCEDVSMSDIPTVQPQDLSDDDLAFIGTVSLETRKQIGDRTSLFVEDRDEFVRRFV